MSGKSQLIQQHISKFKIEMLDRVPFYGDILMRLEFVEDSKIGTACTDGEKVYYNPDFMAGKKEAERNYILMHEIMHILLCHPSRGKGKRHKIFNIAADVVVNSLLDGLVIEFGHINIPFARPDDAIIDTNRYRKKSAENLENIYEEIAAENPKRTGGKGTVVLPNGYGVGSERSYGNNLTEIETRKNTIYNDICEKTAVGENELGISPESFVNEILRSAVEADAKSRGSGKSIWIPDFAINLTNQKPLDWKKLLKSHLTEVADDEVSYVTPERKYIHMDIILPGHGSYNESMGDVWAFIDTSGSISQEELDEFETQLCHILRQFKNKLHIAYWDTSVSDVYKDIRTKEDILKAVPHSFGGTDINCVYKWIKDNRIKPEVMIILTDGYFGVLRSEYENMRLKNKTIIVLSKDLTNRENIKGLGKIAILEGKNDN